MGRSLPEGVQVRVEVANEPERGEVWVFVGADGAPVVHRCRARTEGGFVFQGDATVRADPVVPADRLVGRVVEVDPARPRYRWGPTAASLRRGPRMAVAAVVRRVRAARHVQ